METTALLARLASKPGVQSTLILSKADGSIIRTSGLVSEPPTASPPKTSRGAANGEAIPNNGSSVRLTNTEMGVADRSSIYEEGRGGEIKSAEEMARMVWAFVEAAGGLVVGLDPEDEVKLLRLRTKKQEFVIVPGERYLLHCDGNAGSPRRPLTRAHRCRLEISISSHTRDATSVT